MAIERAVEYRFVVIGDQAVDAAIARLDAAAAKAASIAGDLDERLRGVDAAAQKTAKGLGDTGRAADKATRDAKKLDRAVDGVDKRFAALAGTAGKLKGALGAALGAVAAEQLLSLGEEGGALQVISRRLEVIGITAENVAELTGRLGGGSRADVERLASAADLAGLAFDEMGGIADAALRIASARGESSHQVFERLSKAVATGRTAMLAQYGVVVDSKAAWQEYAASVGKTAGELTEAERRSAVTTATLRELNAAFGGSAPDKYASNLGAVRDAFNDLGDEIARFAGDRLSDLGAALSALRAGGEASFASDPVRSRTQQIESQIAQMETALTRVESAAAKSGDAVADVLLDLQSEMGPGAFTAMMGLPSDAEVTRITAAYIGAQDRISRNLEAARDLLQEALADEDIKAEQAFEQERAAEAAARERDREAARQRTAQAAAAAAAKRAREMQRAFEQAARDAQIDLEIDAMRLELGEEVALSGPQQQALDEERKRLEAQAKKDAEALKAEAERLAAEVQSLRRDDQATLERGEDEDLRAADAAADTGSFTERLAAIQQAADLRVEIARREAEDLERVAAENGVALTGLAEGLAAQITEINVRASRRRMQAWADEAAAQAASFSALASSAETLAEAVGAGEAAMAAIKGGAMVALAAEEGAKAIASAASYDFIGAAAHALAAVAAGKAALEHFKVAGGGGAGAARPPAGAGGGRRPAIDESQARSSGRSEPVQQTYNINLGGMPLADERSIELAVLRSIRSGSRAPGRPRTTLSRIRA